MTTLPRVGAVVLTYNSDKDLAGCLQTLVNQEGVDLRIIVVDNNSDASSRAKMIEDFISITRSSVVLRADHIPADFDQGAYFLQNHRNAGYSAGNNIGARFALAIGCDAILVVNPDVRVSNPSYVSRLVEGLGADNSVGIAASQIVNLSGDEENPMAELSFWKEFAWPLTMFSSRDLRKKVEPDTLPRRRFVEKVSGACFMISADAMQKIGFFDENVFLYCEEAILAHQMKDLGLKIAFLGDLSVQHAHEPTEKGDAYRRFAFWSASRRYFHETYSGRSSFERSLLLLSRATLLIALRFRRALSRLRYR
ncbi:glycosyltransferase family 2 protein [Qipengyuania gaetbuli]|uniref:glycosyltransferase family 2 protein n=1 Tax=Qipengyuania gaetbuli TaxID=266952 RepID=UPI001CD1C5E6|nr:glycosyltransferase family 2 protein [Qipengyuania gaetbuli]MCA0911029.1 glycosyltransferase family 2 protein [Qipengyuania gaetbuli]